MRLFYLYMSVKRKTYKDMIVVNSKEELEKLINQRIEQRGPKCDLNDIDVSKVTDMSELFMSSRFNGDISSWDVSSVRDMSCMFERSVFKGDLSKWDVRNVRNMFGMFYDSLLEGNEPDWYKSSR